MTLTPEQQQSFQEASKPLVQWLNDNCHPHVTAFVTPNSAELAEGICNVIIDEFIKD